MENIIYPNRNSTNFPLFLKNNLKNFEYKSKEEYLKYYQFLIYKYLTTNDKARGLLLYIETGYGKTITAVSISEYFRQNTDRNIIIITPKNTINNYKKTIEFYATNINKLSQQQSNKIIENNYKFITLASNKLIDKIKEHLYDENELNFEKNLQILTKTLNIENKTIFENSLLIVDESHNLFNSIANKSINATKLYNSIMNTKDIKLIFLTGTPMINDPLEICSCFNMLHGYKEIKMDKLTKKITLLPEMAYDFFNYFVDYGNSSIKNKEIFTSRIFGLVSYYGHIYDKSGEISKLFPKLNKLVIENVNMSAEQLAMYCIYKEKESSEVAFGEKITTSTKWRESKLSSSYKVKTRLISNVLMPDVAVTKEYGKSIKDINKVTNEYLTLDKLKIYSPKILRLLDNINNHKNQLGLIYSNFVENEGLGFISISLSANGYQEYNMISGDINKHTNTQDNTKRYAIISGKTDPNAAINIIDVFSSDENMHGELICLLLISSTGAEGLDLKNIRHVHIFEPFWNYARIEQVIARAVRFNSHSQLPNEEKNVTPYIYLATISENDKKVADSSGKNYAKCVLEKTTDEKIWEQSIQNKKLIDSFKTALIESSIDCNIHKANLIPEYVDKINCKLCAPTNQQLFVDILTSESLEFDYCKPYDEEEIEAKEIIINNKDTYYYTLDNNGFVSDIFKHIKNSDKYVSLKELKDSKSKDLYIKILAAIEKEEKKSKKITGGNINNISYNNYKDFKYMIDDFVSNIKI